MSRSSRLLRYAVSAAVAVSAVCLIFAEDRRPLRQATQPRARRQLDNLVLGASSLATAGMMQRSVLEPLLDARRSGLTACLPPAIQPFAAFLLLDWAMYWWHRWTHEVDALWRLHRVHHVDRDLDMSTAIRFHFVDQLVSLPMRAAMILIISPDKRTHALWNRFFFASVLFHHTNVRLPPSWERILSLLLTTPRMHGIHHMARRDATDSNWTSGFSLWDRVHGSFRLDLPDEAIPIGVPGYPDQIGTLASLKLPENGTSGDWTRDDRVEDLTFRRA